MEHHRRQVGSDRRNALERVHEPTVFAVAYQAELRDRETGNHLERTARYVESLATQLRRTPELQQYHTKTYVRDTSLASYLPDGGKAGISDSILLKPGKLTEEDIPLSARIMAVCDVYDAVRSIRPYKPAMSHIDAARIIRNDASAHLDPAVVAAFSAIADEFEAISVRFSAALETESRD